MKHILFLIPTVLLLSACAREPLFMKRDEPAKQPPAQVQPDVNEKPDPGSEIITFAKVNEVVFAVSCTGCHTKNTDSLKPELKQYRQYKDYINEVYETVVVDRSMPKRKKLSEDEISLVKKWVEQGGRE